MLYAVIAYEQIYQGSYGRISNLIVEGTEDDAEQAAIEESYAIMEEFDAIMEELKENVFERNVIDEDDEEDFQELLEEEMAKNIAYEIYPITINTTHSLEQLEEEFNNDPEIFIRRYCNTPI